jgi:hypothetical protein
VVVLVVNVVLIWRRSGIFCDWSSVVSQFGSRGFSVAWRPCFRI